MAARNFPGPGINSTTEADSMMIRRPPDNMEIGARPGTMRTASEGKTGLMSIKHTSDQNSK